MSIVTANLLVIFNHGAHALWCGRAHLIVAIAIGLVAVGVSPALAVIRTCGPDPIANTSSVLCTAPNEPCTATAVTMNANTDVISGGCAFDLSGRALDIKKTMRVSGLGFITITNVGNVTIYGTGALKTRGDFNQPAGTVVAGAPITISSTGTVQLASKALMDASGDPGGNIQMTADGGITVENGALVQANGISGSTGYGDGGTCQLVSAAGAIAVGGSINAVGGSQGQGGSVSLSAAVNVSSAMSIDASGGADGGEVEIAAGDDIMITRSIDVQSRQRNGSGGNISLVAGNDELGGITPGGMLTVDSASLFLNGSFDDAGEGAGGELTANAHGPLRFVGATTVIRANAGNQSGADGGSITLDSGDGNPAAVGALDGDIILEGSIVARSGALNGRGGALQIAAGRNAILNATLDMNGSGSGGDFVGTASGDLFVGGSVSVAATSAPGAGGFVDLIAGLATDATLTVAGDIVAAGGTSDRAHKAISLSACKLVVNDGVKIDGRSGVAANGAKGGSRIRLIALDSMDLRSNSQYLASPDGTITTTHPPETTPMIAGSVAFNPARDDEASSSATYPHCSALLP